MTGRRGLLEDSAAREVGVVGLGVMGRAGYGAATLSAPFNPLSRYGQCTSMTEDQG